MKIGALVLSCEHGGNRVPARYRRLFSSDEARAALTSHRGYDIGALGMARTLSRRLRADLHAATVTRLLVELNKSLRHPGLFSEFSARLDARERRAVLDRYYHPHRLEVIEAIRAHPCMLVCHIGVHSFTPELGGVRRNADVSFLYDPARPAERDLCRRFKDALHARAPELRVRRNYPYLGAADGLTTALRRLLPEKSYVGIELETNQAILTGPETTRRRTIDAIADSLAETLELDSSGG